MATWHRVYIPEREKRWFILYFNLIFSTFKIKILCRINNLVFVKQRKNNLRSGGKKIKRRKEKSRRRTVMGVSKSWGFSKSSFLRSPCYTGPLYYSKRCDICNVTHFVLCSLRILISKQEDIRHNVQSWHSIANYGLINSCNWKQTILYSTNL